MTWVKGQSGNPNGRAKGSKNKWRTRLDEAIAYVETKKNKRILHRAVEMAYDDPKVMVAVLKKILPDMRYVEADVRAVHEDWITILEADEKIANSGQGGDLAQEAGVDLSFLR